MITRGIPVFTTNTQAFQEIKAYIVERDGRFENWYTDVTSDIAQSLFVQHRVNADNDMWIYRECPDNRAAKIIKESLIKLGCEGTISGYDNAPTKVYVYYKCRHTLHGFQSE